MLHLGNYTQGIYGTFECEWMLKCKRLYMKELRHMDAILVGLCKKKREAIRLALHYLVLD